MNFNAKTQEPVRPCSLRSGLAVPYLSKMRRLIQQPGVLDDDENSGILSSNHISTRILTRSPDAEKSYRDHESLGTLSTKRTSIVDNMGEKSTKS